MPLKKSSSSYCITNSVIKLIKDRWNEKIICLSTLIILLLKREPKQKEALSGTGCFKGRQQTTQWWIYLSDYMGPTEALSLPLCALMYCSCGAGASWKHVKRPVIAYWSVSVSPEADQWTTHCKKAKQRKPDHAGWWQTHQRAEAQMLLAVLM